MANIDPEKLSKRLTEIRRLEEQKVKIEQELAILTGLVQEKDPEPKGFDYREAVFEVFQNNPQQALNIDDVVQQIGIHYNFKPDRTSVANRINYLADRDKKLERLQGKRGFYCLRQDDGRIEKKGDKNEQTAS